MSILDQIRDRVRQRGFADWEDVQQAEQLADVSRTSPALVLVGDLIQIMEEPGEYTLEDAKRAYLEAHRVAPHDPEPCIELGHYYDAVMDDPARAKPWFELAVQLGAEDAVAALESVEAQLRAV